MTDYILDIAFDDDAEELVQSRLYLTKSTGSVVLEPTLLSAYFDSAEDRAAAMELLRDFDLRPYEREREDWLAHYEQSLEPLLIGDSFIVAPDARLILADTARHALVVPQEQAFGTGSHETTSLCIEMLESMDLAGKRGLDVGAGSGILALAMLRLGAAKVIAFDNDADAYGALRDNRARNGVDAARMPLFIGGVEALRGGRFDVVTMNIIPEVILPLLGDVGRTGCGWRKSGKKGSGGPARLEFETMNQLSDRLRGLVQSDIRRMSRECERVGGINLGQGICDLPTIPELVEGACDAIAANKATYSKFEGIDILRERIARKMGHYNGVVCDPATEVVVTVGSSGGFAGAALATLNAGDEVILFEPYYGYHLNTLVVLGFKPKFVPLHAPDWTIDFDALRAAFTPRTKAIVVCTPSNPSGKMFTRDELERMGALCREHDAWIFTDEIYEYIVCDGRKHVSVASIDSCRDITVTISGFSKTFSITGWRIGYVVAPPRVAGPIGLMNDLLAICAPTPLQWGVARALEVPDSYYVELAAAYQKKRDILASALTEAGFKPSIPQGSYYMLAEIPAEFSDSAEAAKALLEEARVASVPGTAFFESDTGKRMLRFCYAKDFDALEEACKRIRAFRAVKA